MLAYNTSSPSLSSTSPTYPHEIDEDAGDWVLIQEVEVDEEVESERNNKGESKEE
jgi:hypothetical protein